MFDSRRKPKRMFAAYAMVAAVSAAIAIPLIRAQTMPANSQVRRVQLPAADTEKPSTAPAAASAPPPVAGEPGEAPHPSKPDDSAPGNQLERAADAGMQVFVDDSFGAVSELQAARLLASQGQDQKAITAFQKIINVYGQKLVYLNNASYVSITDYVREQLLRMPAVKSGMYDQLYGAEAKMAIDPLVQKHDLAGLIRMCDRYFPSTAALEGLSQAAAWYFERGEFAGASRNWQLLMSHPMATANMRALFLFRATISESLLGDTTMAAALRARLTKEFPDASGIVDGKQTPLLTAADEIIAQPPLGAGPQPPDEWPGFQGGPSHTNLLNVDASIGARLWNVDIHDEEISGQKKSAARNMSAGGRMNGAIYINGQQPERDPNVQSLNAYPVISNGSIFIHTGDRIVSLSINAGTLQWKYPEQPIASETSARLKQMQNAYGYMMHMVSHDSVAIAGNEAFATLPAPPAPQPDEPQRRVVYYGGFSGIEGNTRIVCVARQTGKEIWSTSADTVKLEKPGDLTFVGSPIVTQQGVFSMARKAGEGSFSELYLVRLDRQTGSPTWACYLCSASSGSYYQPIPTMMPIPIPTIENDIVYISTGQGADCAVDANAGRILWLDITEAAKVAKDPRTMYQPNFNTTPSWKFNPPLVSGDRLVCCETSDAASTMRIYDRWTGKLLRSIDSKELHLHSMDVLAGIVGSTAIVIGDKVAAVDIRNDQASEPVWTADYPPGVKQQGRPFLASARLYVPFNQGLLTLDPRTGAQTSFWPWPPTEKTEHEVPIKARPGNLLVTSEQVIVLNDDELAGYSKWETARDNRLDEIKARPADPEAYLALAEISFRTKHYDLAQENMKWSVELANAAAAVPGAAVPEILGRLYRINLDFAEQLLNDPDVKARDLSRFYYDECKLSARDPGQRAEWRLCMSELSLLQDKPDEAATLYSEVLTDPSLRQASFHRVDDLARAGVVAEDKFRALIARPGGAAVYKRFEDQAQSMLNQARANRDSKLLKQVVDGYPNSASAVAAATDLASAAREAHDIPGQLKALYWMLPRVNGDKLAAVTAETANACLALPKPRYSSAIAWTERGLRQFKDFHWIDSDTHATMSFASLREKLRAAPAAALVEGRLPVLPSKPLIADNGRPKLTAEGKPVTLPDMQADTLADPLALGTLLVPVEQSPAMRRPDLLFIEHRRRIHIFDTARGVELTSPEIASGGGNIRDPGGLSLGNDQPAILLGCVGDTAIFVQSDAAVAVNVKSLGIAWRVDFAGAGSDAAAMSVQERMQSRRAMANRQLAQNVMIVNGMVIDRRTGQPYVNSPADPEAAREASFASLGRPAFSTVRIVNDKLISVSGDKISANSIAGGKLLWSKPLGAAGNASVVLGNEDVVVAQVDNNTRAGSTFVTFDAGTGAVLKNFRMKDGERVEWRGISDDGVFFVATNLGLAAYDLLNNESRPIWRREGMTSTYPAATAITLDGLVFLKNGKDLLCLSSETGDIIWPQGAPLDIGTAVANGTVQTPFIRSVVDGDSVIFQSSGWLKEYRTTRDVQDHMVWESAEIQPGDSPPMESFQVADPDVVVMEAGARDNSMQHTVNLVLYARDGGKMKLKKQISKRAGEDEGPNIFAWQVVDNGIAMETDRQPNDPDSGKVYFYRGNKPAAKAE